MREYDVGKCECGRYIAYKPSIHFMWTVAQTGKLENTQGDDPGFCAGCNMKFGIDERGPWREAMVSRAALEWAVHEIDGCVYHDGRECAVVESGEENEDCFDGICFEHRMQAALKAAEEAHDE